ncbi:MAG: pyridoxamine 5'-phosphate oxidase family protein [Deltaproteobacteria bacterium]
MAKQFAHFEQSHLDLIAESHIFFVGTAAPTGQVNISPKGRDSLRVLGPNRLIWRNLTGSGNETAGHLTLINRMTLMWCSFTTRPVILRAYGTARIITPNDADWSLNADFEPDPGARQIYDMQVDLVQTSCGYAVPFMEFVEERDTLATWSAQKSEDDIKAYWLQKNTKTIDGFQTAIEAQAT